MKKYRWLIILLLIILIGGAVWYWMNTKKEDEVTLVTEKPHYGDITNSVTSTGRVQPVDTVVVGTQISGPIQSIFVDFNSKVKKGQLLAQIDRTVLEAQLQQIQANYASALSQLTYAKTTYDRQEKLYKVGAISQVDEETALNSYNTAKAQVDNLQSQITAAKKNLSYTEIYSPIDGTVLSRNVSVGQTVAASFNTPTLFVIAKDLTKMQVQAAVDEADIGNVKVGQDATFTVDAFPDDVFKGKVSEIRLQPAVSSNVVTYTTMVDAPNNEMKLKPGMTASITIITKEDSNALLIPAKALTFQPDSAQLKKYVIVGRRSRASRGAGAAQQTQRRPGNADTTGKKHLIPKDSSAQPATVWLLRGDSIIQKRIFTGLNDDANVEIISGLKEQDEVITGTDTQSKNGKADAAARSPFLPQRNRGGSGGGGRRPQ
ncbi:MAG TPA: efflux RND transporter periplasmic adaptor subunit [Chitinophagaceae bacterium]|nr:efflux RND transporter periplasmic adaptor subunit [Chitinophagaceae bacterium]